MANSTAKPLADPILNVLKGSTLASAFAAFAANPLVTVYVGLYSTTPTTNANLGGTEISGSSYARQPITCASGWSAISLNADNIHDQISNSAVITFPIVTGSGYTVVGVGIFDAITTGNELFYVAVTSQAVAIGNQYQIAIGALIVEI
jgi:hypothetical protein